MKECPFCSEDIQDSAKKCKHCGEFLEDSSGSKEYISFNYSFILEEGRGNFVEFMEKEAGIHDVTYKKNTWTETSGGGSSFFDKHTVKAIESKTFMEYELSFNIGKNSPFANKEFIDQCFKYHNLTYKRDLGGLLGIIILCMSVGIVQFLILIFGYHSIKIGARVVPINTLSSNQQFYSYAIGVPILLYLFTKIITSYRKKIFRDSKSYYKKKIDTFLKK